ncbi:hypothetical protein SAY87_028014 [Trapa incisa]|uniref:Uncharacterized protein n=1 Tax=Trapa incisa TaxID=236973 RepID=A0AAN7KU42_9MYRT|nr:hypothetical protein SAY87_028014 [Trapa incisa]
MYSGLLVNPTPAGYISSAVAGPLSDSSLGHGCNGFDQPISDTSVGFVLGPCGTYESSVKAQAGTSQIGHAFVSSRNKGAGSGYTSSLCFFRRSI